MQQPEIDNFILWTIKQGADEHFIETNRPILTNLLREREKPSGAFCAGEYLLILFSDKHFELTPEGLKEREIKNH